MRRDQWHRFAPVVSLVAGLLLSGCSTSVQRIGAASYPSLPQNADVLVFTAQNQIHQPFEVVGVISHSNAGKYQILTLTDAIEPLKTKAREVGANAVIIDKSEPVKSGLISTGIYVEARAIRLVPNSQ